MAVKRQRHARCWLRRDSMGIIGDVKEPSQDVESSQLVAVSFNNGDDAYQCGPQMATSMPRIRFHSPVEGLFWTYPSHAILLSGLFAGTGLKDWRSQAR